MVLKFKPKLNLEFMLKGSKTRKIMKECKNRSESYASFFVIS